ncbi:organic hydroperoxide resistance protein [Streptomyces olivochromogenes]|uniref:Organic hydroperoxide resistance protein n=1 Tax=Streptomyces olivochromogenes TaxID=1963 RepID=A0A250V6Y5_STROL|nr:organic hydroperoxide resistance protein [Streptomyces olivochromogenes]KUN45958.1 organic hydroperoxide resistance protein [Streptomyces olivochromogenes]GAX49941.1 organic hydroperoxide resistance protein [Streptomyces olivochromogenes]
MSTTTLYTTEALSTGDGRNGEVRSLDGVLDEVLAVPKEMGGPGGDRTNPEQLFAAGYAACFHNGLRLIAAQQDVKVPGSTVTSTVSLLSKEDGGFTLAVKLSVHLPGVEQTTADRLVQTTHQVCPYSNATRGNIDVILEATV